MSGTNKANTVAFHTKAVFEDDVESVFRIYGGTPYRQHNPLIEDGSYPCSGVMMSPLGTKRT